MSFIVRFYLLALLLAFQSANAIASCSDWLTLKPNSKKETFILAMGANTGDLKMANHDAQSFAKAMQKRYKVPKSHVCVYSNVKRGQFEKALKRLAKLVRKKDRVFIFFSGHGTTLKDIKNKDEKDCLDEAFVMQRRSLRDDDFVAKVNRLKTDHITTFLDSCFSSGMLRGKKGCPKGVKTKFWLNPKTVNTLPSRSCRVRKLLKKLKGTLYAAAKEDQLAWESPKGGIFTYTFLKNMKTRPRATLDNIFRLTAKQVAKATKNTACEQHPQKWP